MFIKSRITEWCTTRSMAAIVVMGSLKMRFQVFLPSSQMDLPGALLVWAKEHGLTDGSHSFSHASADPVENGGR